MQKVIVPQSLYDHIKGLAEGDGPQKAEAQLWLSTVEPNKPLPPYEPMPGETPDLAMFGWAPGGYTFTCVDCSTEDNERLRMERWAAKRAWRCEQHAQEKLDAWHGRNRNMAPAAGAPKTAVDG
jgi:hypothetical protein